MQRTNPRRNCQKSRNGAFYRTISAFGTTDSTFKSWRGRQGHKTTDHFPEPVPTSEKVYIFPAFSLNWFIAWDRIKNGELVVTETISSCGQKTIDFDVPEFKSHRALSEWSGVIPPASNLRPDRAAIGYAQP